MADEAEDVVEVAQPRRPGRKPTYPKGQEPWTLEGVSRSTWDRKNKQKAEDAPAAPVPAPAAQQDVPAASTSAVEDKPATVAAPAPIEAPAAQHKPVEAPAPAISTPPAVPVAIVNVTLRSRIDQHDRLREMAHRTRRSIQDIVSGAVDRYLDAEGF